MTRDTFEAIIRYYQRKEHRLRLRLNAETDSTESFRLRRAIRRNQSKLAPMQDFLGRQDGPDGQWITMNGTHVLVEGGTISGGPPNLKGKPHRPRSGGEASKSQGAENATLQKKEYHPVISDELSQGLQKYTNRMQKQGQSVIANKKETDEKVKAEFGDTTMTTSEFAERSMAAVSSWSEEDKILDAAYTGSVGGMGGALGVEYGELNRKLRQGETLSDSEQAVVDHFARCAEPIGKPTDLYRMVGQDYLDSILSSSGVSDIQQLVGQTVTNDALQSTCAGAHSFFKQSSYSVSMKIKAPADSKVCFTSDVGEGEIVIPAGAKMRIVGVNTAKPATIKDMNTERDPRTALPMWQTLRDGRSGGIETNARNCGFVTNMGSIHSIRKSIYIEMELIP